MKSALNASNTRPDLRDALTGRYLNLMTSDAASTARAIKFFGGLFDQMKENPGRKPAAAGCSKLLKSQDKR